MRAPGFWQRDGVLPRALAPVERLVAQAAARRIARPGWQAPVPVICCGNATVGGAGKTTLALDLTNRLLARGVAVHCLSRGYGGRVAGPWQVHVGRDGAEAVGDEPLLLAAVAPTWVGRDRAASARAAVAAGAAALVMDDGLQHPGLVQDLALLVVDGAVGFGNGRVLPAGPLRERLKAAAKRCHAAVLIGADACGAAAALPQHLPVLRARLIGTAGFDGRRVLAFAGIARPGKLGETLTAAGAVVVELRAFADHHVFRPVEVEQVLSEARRLGAVAVTTAKDAVRLPPGFREQVEVAGVRIAWQNESRLEAMLRAAVP